MPTSRCSAEQDATRLFVDALRACLGLAPLYAPETESVYGEECSAKIAAGQDGMVRGPRERHEVRSVAVEEKRWDEVAAAVPERKPGGIQPIRLRSRKRWNWDKARTEAAE